MECGDLVAAGAVGFKELSHTFPVTCAEKVPDQGGSADDSAGREAERAARDGKSAAASAHRERPGIASDIQANRLPTPRLGDFKERTQMAADLCDFGARRQQRLKMIRFSANAWR